MREKSHSSIGKITPKFFHIEAELYAFILSFGTYNVHVEIGVFSKGLLLINTGGVGILHIKVFKLGHEVNAPSGK